jgi:hypothetical protein
MGYRRCRVLGQAGQAGQQGQFCADESCGEFEGCCGETVTGRRLDGCAQCVSPATC